MKAYFEGGPRHGVELEIDEQHLASKSITIPMAAPGTTLWQIIFGPCPDFLQLLYTRTGRTFGGLRVYEYRDQDA